MSDRARYYGEMKALAAEMRADHSVRTAAFGLREVRQVYKAEGVIIDIRKLPNRLKAIYMCDDGEASVAIRESLPEEPKIFALVHELKHHRRDQALLTSGAFICGDYNANEVVEIGAEIFAAEFIYPEQEFRSDLDKMKVTRWQAEDIVRFKKTFCQAKVSYTFIRKRLRRFGLIQPDEFRDVQFKKLEERMYGVPFYRQPRFRNRRRPAATI